MRGKIHLIKRGVGKIVLENGKESAILNLPDSFEDEDSVEVEFRDNNINEKPIHLVAYSIFHYGFVINQFSRNSGIILVTYPSLQGTILYRNQPLEKNQKVKFKIKKTLDGKLEAVNLKSAKRDEFYRCSLPVFGKIEIEKSRVKEGLVSRVVKDRDDFLSGQIKVVKNDKGFGFIKVDENPDVFFAVKKFQEAFGTLPQKGRKVNFLVIKTPRGLSVKKFLKSSEDGSLPEDKQYGVISNQRFSLKDFREFYKREPQAGDIVNYVEKDGKIIFKNSLDEEEVNLIFKQKRGFKVQKGEIKSLKKGFGFIKTDGKNIFFLIKIFKNFYKREPQIGDIVSFTYEENEKGFSVKRFYQNEFKINKKAFKNFTDVEPNQLYLAYIDGAKAEEIYKYEPDNLSQSIACYKDKNIDAEFRLKAIECIIKNGYSSKNITTLKVLNDQKRVLKDLIERELKNGSRHKALEYEAKLQNIEYEPKRFQIFSNLSNKKALIEDLSGVEFKEVSNEKPINFIEQKPKDIEPLNSEKFYNIIEKVEIKEYKPKTKKWEIDI